MTNISEYVHVLLENMKYHLQVQIVLSKSTKITQVLTKPESINQTALLFHNDCLSNVNKMSSN